MTGFLLYFLLLAESLRLTLLQKLVLPELPVLFLFLLYYSRSESHRKFPALLFLEVQVLRYLPRYLEFQFLLYQIPAVGDSITTAFSDFILKYSGIQSPCANSSNTNSAKFHVNSYQILSYEVFRLFFLEIHSYIYYYYIH